MGALPVSGITLFACKRRASLTRRPPAKPAAGRRSGAARVVHRIARAGRMRAPMQGVRSRY